MHDIFTLLPPGTLATQGNANASNVAKGIRDNLTRAIAYQSKPEFYLRNEHILVRLLKTMPAPSTNIPSEIYFAGIDLISTVDGAMGILSEGNSLAGNNKGNFYSDNVIEYIFDFRSTVPIANFAKDLFKYSAVKVFYHPYTSLDYKPVDGALAYASPNAPYCVIGIDIALLYTQYHVWMDNLGKSTNGKPAFATANNFAYGQVIAKMLESHVLQAITNRFIALYANEPNRLSTVTTRTPYSIVDHHKAVDDLLTAQIDTVRRAKMDFYTVMGSIPIAEYSLLDSSRLPKLPRVSQLRFIQLMARLELSISLGLNDEFGPTGMNASALQYWNVLYGTLENNSSLEVKYPAEANKRLTELEEILRKRKRL